jgi:small ligand-binding sensory domain FIST
MDSSTRLPMKWVSSLSKRPSLEAAVNEVTAQVSAAMDGPADLGLLFISSTFASEYPRLLPLIRERISVPVLIGCSGGAIVGTAPSESPEEIEDEPALALCLARLPGVTVQPFWVCEEDLPDLDSSPQSWVDCIGVDPAVTPQFILLSDPFTANINDLLQGLDFAYPGAVKLGGLASGSSRVNGLFLDDEYYDEGTVGVALSGPVLIKPIVSQGCRPVGPVFRVTDGDRNVLIELQEDEAGKQGDLEPAVDALQRILQDLSEEDRDLAQTSLFVGVAYSEFQENLYQGDFLIRNLLGIDPRAGAIAIGDRVRRGQRIQFHLRDAQASADDLEMLLKRYQRESGSEQSMAVLMFSCMGRGESLYDEPNFDSGLLRQYFPTIPTTGFFCNGEIGPIGGSTYLHGYTSVFGICCQP